MNKAILIQADDWEGLFINGRLVEEGHTLHEGNSRVKYFSQLSKDYDFNLDEMKELWITDEDDEILYQYGSFPLTLDELHGDYENMEEE